MIWTIHLQGIMCNMLIFRAVQLHNKNLYQLRRLGQGMMKPGIKESPASTLLEIALPLDHEGVMHHKNTRTENYHVP